MNNAGGTLEVLLVNARGIKHTHLVGTSSFYVLIECGSQCQRSKVSVGKHGKIWWNEKFTFEFSSSDCNDITHFKCRIMDKELFKKGGFVGETIVYIRGIITEGTDEGHIEMKPTPYNVVLEDDTYKGQIKIGFKFIAKTEPHGTGFQTKELNDYKHKQPSHSIGGSIRKLWRLSWWKFLFFYNRKNSKDKHKRV